MFDRIHPRVFAALLVIGSIVSLVPIGSIFLNTTGALIVLQRVFLLFMTGVLILAIATGVSLWRGGDLGKDGAPLLFAAQIPIVAIPYFQFDWYTGFTFSLVSRFGAGDTFLNADVNLGSSFVLWVHPLQDQYSLGINVFAVFATIALVRSRRRAIESGQETKVASVIRNERKPIYPNSTESGD